MSGRPAFLARERRHAIDFGTPVLVASGRDALVIERADAAPETLRLVDLAAVRFDRAPGRRRHPRTFVMTLTDENGWRRSLAVDVDKANERAYLAVVLAMVETAERRRLGLRFESGVSDSPWLLAASNAAFFGFAAFFAAMMAGLPWDGVPAESLWFTAALGGVLAFALGHMAFQTWRRWPRPIDPANLPAWALPPT